MSFSSRLCGALVWGIAAMTAMPSGLRAEEKPKVIHAFVALCDNATQGIVPVPAKIGNGDDPDRNLYWGCDDGLRQVFKKSKSWRLVESRKEPAPATVLERLVFKHTSRNNVWLVAHAYRGAEMKRMMDDFLQAVSGAAGKTLDVKAASDAEPIQLPGSGQADFLAFIGHNGLMDFSTVFPPSQRAGALVPVTVLCCKSNAYFTAQLGGAGGRPLVMTTQFMYPGSFLLHAMLEGWLAGESAPALKERAAAAYARNQKISVKAARGVFTVPEEAGPSRTAP